MWAFLSKVWYHRIKLIGFGGISIMNEIVELISKYNHCTHLRLMFTIRLLNDYFQKNAMNSIADDTRYKTICSHLMQDENIRLSGVTSSGLNFYKVINSELLDEELLNSINETKLATSNKVEEDFFSTVSTSGYTIYNVYDKKGTPIILDIESKEELIEKVKELTSSLLG